MAFKQLSTWQLNGIWIARHFKGCYEILCYFSYFSAFSFEHARNSNAWWLHVIDVVLHGCSHKTIVLLCYLCPMTLCDLNVNKITGPCKCHFSCRPHISSTIFPWKILRVYLKIKGCESHLKNVLNYSDCAKSANERWCLFVCFKHRFKTGKLCYCMVPHSRDKQFF